MFALIAQAQKKINPPSKPRTVSLDTIVESVLKESNGESPVELAHYQKWLNEICSTAGRQRLKRNDFYQAAFDVLDNDHTVGSLISDTSDLEHAKEHIAVTLWTMYRTQQQHDKASTFLGAKSNVEDEAVDFDDMSFDDQDGDDDQLCDPDDPDCSVDQDDTAYQDGDDDQLCDPDDPDCSVDQDETSTDALTKAIRDLERRLSELESDAGNADDLDDDEFTDDDSEDYSDGEYDDPDINQADDTDTDDSEDDLDGEFDNLEGVSDLDVAPTSNPSPAQSREKTPFLSSFIKSRQQPTTEEDEQQASSIFHTVAAAPRAMLNDALKTIEDQGCGAWNQIKIPKNPHPEKSPAHTAWARGFKKTCMDSMGLTPKPATQPAKKQKRR